MSTRPPRRARHLSGVDQLRGFAALLVVTYHVWVLTNYAVLDDGPGRAILGAGYSGLDLLFIISGFVLFLPAAQNGTIGDGWSYAKRRIARIAPAYYVVLVVTLLARPFLDAPVGPVAAPGPLNTGEIIPHLFFLQVETPGYVEGGFGVNGVVWTMSLEALFYLALPFVAAWYARRPVVGLVGALSVSILWRLAVTNLDVWLTDATSATVADLELRLVTQFPTYLFHFALGMTAAWAFTRIAPSFARRRSRGRALALTGVRLGAIGASLVTVGFFMHRLGQSGLDGTIGPYPQFTLNTLPYVVGFAGLVLAMSLNTNGALTWWGRAWAWAGKVSYGVYLTHLLVIRFALETLEFPQDGSGVAFIAMIALTAPVSLGLGWLSFRFIETPARAWARRGGPRRRQSIRVQPGGQAAGAALSSAFAAGPRRSGAQAIVPSEE
ncbi:MAG: acyltransferase family protein [Actinomycetota bacterium]